MDANLTRLSKVMAKALRHTPWQFELEMDDEGWVSIQALLDALRSQRAEWHDLSEAEFAAVIAQSDKGRYQMRDGKIRALYGHSTPQRLAKTPATPPDILYHGTTKSALLIILKEGLKPMSRQYVHLSFDLTTAQIVARRKGEAIIILTVDSARAHADGIPFYQGNDTVWLADSVPPQYLTS